jgi:O-antigen/teichoic acid export membrane protein
MINKIKAFLFENKGVHHTVVKNTVWLFLGEIVGRLLKLVLVIYAARLLGTSQWGVFSYVLGLASLFGIFSDFGLGNLLTREMAKGGVDKLKYLSTIFVIKLVLTFTSVLLLILIAPNISKISELKSLVPIMSLILIFDSIREFGFGLSRAYEKMEIEAFVKIIINSFISLVGLYVIFNLSSVKNVLCVYAIGSGIGTLVLFYILRKNLKNIFSNFSKELIKPILDFTWPFAILIFFNAIMTNTDILMLGWLSTPQNIGFYSVAQKLTQFLYIIPSLISIALFPTFSKMVQNGSEKFEIMFTKIIRLLLLFGFPVVIGGAMLSKSIILLVFGNEYIDASMVLSIMFFMILVNFPTVIVDNAILAHNQQKRFLKYTLGAVILNVILCYVLIPMYGPAGAATATLASSFLGMGMVFTQFRKANNFKSQFNLGKIIISTAIMTLTIFGLSHTQISLIPTVAISIAIYALSIYILKDQTVHEIMPNKVA